jgi:hypothetical protein
MFLFSRGDVKTSGEKKIPGEITGSGMPSRELFSGAFFNFKHQKL